MNLIITALIMFSVTPGFPVKLMTSPVLQEKLNLSDTQIEKIREVWFKTEPTLIDLRAQKAKIMLNIREELNKDEVNFDKLSKLYEKLGDVDARIKFTRAKMVVNVKKVLTKDQIKKLRLMGHRWRKNMRAHRKMWHQPHPMAPGAPPMIER